MHNKAGSMPAATFTVCMWLQVEQNAVDLEGEGSPGFNTAEALRSLLVKKGLITPEVLWG
jgi:hypothetical protein